MKKQPPAAIEELPPDARPQGDHVSWIPGYWAWDEDRNDYIWVSGIWRNTPPGERWVPGYWAQIDNGYQWVAGSWVDAEAQHITYLPQPPDNIDEGPTTTSPGDDYFWVPGCWRWGDARYLWRPGYWSRGYANWLWIPDRYCYSPRGSYFCHGYWDYGLARRGWLFAPVWFRGDYYAPRGFYFTPRSLVDTALLTASLFIGPNYRHYYYGDFDGRRGYYPWYAYHLSHRGYDPFFAHDVWRYGSRNRDWYNNLARDYRDGRVRSNRDVTADLDRFRRAAGEQVADRGRSLVRPMNDLVRDRGTQVTRLNDNERRDLGQRSRDYQRLGQDRLKAEAEGRNNLRAERLTPRAGETARGRDIEGRVELPRNYQPRTFDLPRGEAARQGTATVRSGERTPYRAARPIGPPDNAAQRMQITPPNAVERGPRVVEPRGTPRVQEGRVQEGDGQGRGEVERVVPKQPSGGDRGGVDRGSNDRGDRGGGSDRGVQRGGDGSPRGGDGGPRGGGDGGSRGGGGAGSRDRGRGGR
ncbi:MAG: hypothetical protein K8T25_14330 [Planctomycetia bacterium]|nr:hypothetical protein [Planctomycetia bacterium]